MPRSLHQLHLWSKLGTGPGLSKFISPSASIQKPISASANRSAIGPARRPTGSNQMRTAPASGRKIRIVASQSVISLHPHEDEGEDGHAPGDRERVRADEPGLDLAQLVARVARAGRDLAERAEERALDPVAQRRREHDGRAVEDRVVELVEVELVLEDG